MVKPLLFAALLCAAGYSSPAVAQVWHSPLPVDSASQHVTYTGVVQVSGASQAELYSRAREWFANTFGSSKAVLEMDDREAGKLVGKAYAEFPFAGMGKPLPWAMWRKIKVEVKDGRYRYTLDAFELGGPIATPAANVRPIEPWLAPTIAKGKEPGKMVLSVIEGIQQTAQSEAASLRAAMGKKSDGF